jgi:uncharacterized repeat protein (TIGR01451 family)
MSMAFGRMPSTSIARRIVAVTAAISALVIGLSGSPASAAGQIPDDPATWPQNIPDNKSCGPDNLARWVKFTAGGSGPGSFAANSGTPKWSAAYTVTTNATNPNYPQSLSVSDVKDEFGNPVRFRQLVTGVASINPVWSFPPAYQSGVLDVPSDKNFSQFALCAYPPDVKLIVTKVVDWKGEPSLQPAPSFTVTVSCVVPPGPGGTNFATPSTLTLVDGASGTVTAPAGTICTATDVDSRFTTAPATVTLLVPTGANATQTATVTNTYKVFRSLTVTKTVVYPAGWAALPTDQTAFQFTVLCNGAAVAGSPFTLSNAGSVNVAVPFGQTCSVSEAAATNFITTSVPTPATAILMDANKTAAFTNTRTTGTLLVTKTAVGDNGTFQVNVDCGAGHTFTAAITTTGGTGTASFGPIPVGVSCAVTEAKLAGWTQTAGPAAAVIIASGSNPVGFTNVRDTGDLVVTKTAIGGSDTFGFSIVCGQSSVTRSITTGGTASTTVTGIPTGTSCTVTETAPPAGWSLTSVTGPAAASGAALTFTTAASGNVVAFVNTRDTGTARITKTIDGGSGTFAFSVTCGTVVRTVSVTIVAPATSGSADVADLPTGSCGVAETAQPVGYNGAASQTITIAKGATTNVGFRNDRQIDLAVVKANTGAFVTGSGAIYTIDVTNNGPSSETHAVVTDVVPAGLTFVSASGSGWTCTTSLPTVTCVNDSVVPAGGVYPTITLAVTITGAAGTPITNEAVVTGAGIDIDLSNNDSSVTRTPTAVVVDETTTTTTTTTTTLGPTVEATVVTAPPTTVAQLVTTTRVGPVVLPAQPITPSALPKTGASSRVLVALALGLLAFGLGAIEFTNARQIRRVKAAMRP